MSDIITALLRGGPKDGEQARVRSSQTELWLYKTEQYGYYEWDQEDWEKGYFKVFKWVPNENTKR